MTETMHLVEQDHSEGAITWCGQGDYSTDEIAKCDCIECLLAVVTHAQAAVEAAGAARLRIVALEGGGEDPSSERYALLEIE